MALMGARESQSRRVDEIKLGFAVVVQNEIKQEATEGVQAARNLFYREFPLEGMHTTSLPKETGT